MFLQQGNGGEIDHVFSVSRVAFREHERLFIHRAARFLHDLFQPFEAGARGNHVVHDAHLFVFEKVHVVLGKVEFLNVSRGDARFDGDLYAVLHIEFFANFEGIAEAKAEIFKSLKKGGLAFINEDTNFASLLEKRAIENGAEIIKFGKTHHPEVGFKLSNEGEHYLYNAWCVLSVVKALGLDVCKAAASLKDFGALEGRGKEHLLSLENGGHYTLIDDSYSGQPEAMKLAIETLDKKKISKGRKIVVLGKMAELGETSQLRHIEIGKLLAQTSVDIVIGVCPEMKDMLAQLPASKQQYYFENKEGLDEFLLNKCLQNNDIVLIKGARYSSKLYQVTESLLKKGA